MKIKKRLRLNTLIFLGVVILTLFSVVWLLRDMDQIKRNEFLVSEIKMAALDRIVLRDDWVLNREDRARDQWYAKTEKLRGLLETAAQVATSKKSKELLESAKADFEGTVSSFSLLLEKHKRTEHTAKKKLDFTEAGLRLISQLFLKAYSLNDNINRLHEDYRIAAITAFYRGIILIIVFIAVGIAAMVINSILINKIVTKRLTALNEGISIISNGNLDYHFDDTGDDELTDLAKASNEMTVKLRDSYTSLETLNIEIAERKKAEQESLQNEERFQTIFGQAPLGIALTDSLTGDIYEVNAKFANIAGRTLKEMAKIDWMSITHPDDVQEDLDNMVRLNAGEIDGFQMNKRYLRPNGSVVWISMTIAPLQLTGKKHSFHLCMIEDITDRQAAEEEIKKLNEDLEVRVAKRTEELITKTTELQRINKVFVDRELRMRELKARIAELEKTKNVSREA